MSIVTALVVCVGVSLAPVLLPSTPATAADLDGGNEVVVGTPATPEGLDDCYPFGGASQSFSGSGRMRGNTYTVSASQILSEIQMELDFTGNATLYFYVLESPTLSGTYTVLSETIINLPGAGQTFYTTGPILGVNLEPGTFYGIGVAWGPETVTYVRDAAALPRNWDLGTVEDALQHSAAPPYTTVAYNHFTGAEYSMQLCFAGAPTPTELSTWGQVKAVYR